MAFIIGLDAKDNSARAFNSIEKRAKKTTKELEKVAKAAQGRGAGVNQFGELMRANRAGAGTGGGGVGGGGAEPAGAPGRPSSIGTGGGQKQHESGLMRGAQEVAGSVGMGGPARGVGKAYNAFRGAFGGGGGGGGRPAVGGGEGGEGIAGGAASRVSALAFGIGAVVGVSIGLIQNVGKKYQDLAESQGDTIRALDTGLSGASYGVMSAERAAGKLAYSEASGKAQKNGFMEFDKLTSQLGLDAGTTGKIYGSMAASDVTDKNARGYLFGAAGKDKIVGRQYFQQLGKVLEEAIHDGFTSGTTNYGEGVAQGLASVFGMKVNGQQINANRAGGIFSSLDQSFKGASNLEGGGKNGLLFAAIKNQMGPSASILDVMGRLESGASASNIQAFMQQMNNMGLSEDQKAFFLKTQMGMSVQESKAVARGESGIGQVVSAEGDYSTTGISGRGAQQAAQNTLIAHGRPVAEAKEAIDKAMINAVGKTAEGVEQLIADFKEYTQKPALDIITDLIQRMVDPTYALRVRLMGDQKAKTAATSKGKKK